MEKMVGDGDKEQDNEGARMLKGLRYLRRKKNGKQPQTQDTGGQCSSISAKGFQIIGAEWQREISEMVRYEILRKKII